jgi:DnaK suppressor protein
MDETKERLIALLQDLTKRGLAHKDGLIIQGGADPLDKAQDESNRDLAASLGDGTRSLIQAISAALERIEQGEFGICERCEEAIAPKRLKAVPWATLCLGCQEYEERRKKGDQQSTPMRKLLNF